MQDTLSTGPLHGGSEPIPVAAGRYGIQDSLRLQETATPGMALSRRNSALGDKYLDVFKFGNASARAEFMGVLATLGLSSPMTVAATTSNDDVVQAVYQGYAPVLLAPGYAVRGGQFLEPIPAGTYQAQFRAAVAGGRGPVQALESYENTGTEGIWISGIVNPQPNGSGLLGKIAAASTVVTNTAVETAYSRSVSVLKYALLAANALRIRGAVRCVNNGANGTIVKVKLGTLVLVASATLTPNANDAFTFDLLLDIRSGTTAFLSGYLSAFGAPGTATQRVVAPAEVTIDNSADTSITATVTYAGASANDQTQLESLVAELVN